MSLNPHVTAVRRKAMVDTITASAASGILRIMSGSQPADADAGIGAATVLAECIMNATAFNAPAAVSSTDYVITANAVTTDASANNAGTATWFRLWDSAGTTAILDGTAGTSGCDLNLNSVSISAGAAVSITSMTLTLSA